MYGWVPVKCVWEEERKMVIGLEKEQQPIMRRVKDPITGESILEPTGKTRTRIFQDPKRNS